jgi:hypothetical protein
MPYGGVVPLPLTAVMYLFTLQYDPCIPIPSTCISYPLVQIAYTVTRVPLPQSIAPCIHYSSPPSPTLPLPPLHIIPLAPSICNFDQMGR